MASSAPAGADVVEVPRSTREAPRIHGVELLRFLWATRRDPLTPMVDAIERTGPVLQSRLPGFHSYVVHRPEHVEHVLVTNQDNYGKGPEYDVFATALGRGLVTSSGDLWRRQRRLVQPMFAKRHLEPFAEHMVGAAEREVGGWDDGRVVDVHSAMTELTLDVVGRALFGADLTGETTRAIGSSMDFLMEELSLTGRSAFVRAVYQVPGVSMQSAMRVRVHRRRELVRSLSVLDDVVARLIEERRRTGASREDLLSLLLAARDEDGAPMTDRQVRDEVVTFVSAGHETTANALAWMWWLLGHHPKARARMLEEVDSVLGGRRATFADADALPWTRAVVQETLRLYPPVWILPRLVHEDDEIDGYRIEGGSTLFVLTWYAHRDPEVWPDPEAFDPSRFVGDAGADRPRAAYLPFAHGRRSCVGMTFALTETVLVAATVAQSYTLDPAPGATAHAEPLLTLRPRDGLRMRLARRAR